MYCSALHPKKLDHTILEIIITKASSVFERFFLSCLNIISLWSKHPHIAAALQTFPHASESSLLFTVFIVDSARLGPLTTLSSSRYHVRSSESLPLKK